MTSLFDEMDTIADAVRRNNPDIREGLSDELQLEFRQGQRRRMPELSREHWLELFAVWRDAYIARLDRE
jgi:hypothetical protein